MRSDQPLCTSLFNGGERKVPYHGASKRWKRNIQKIHNNQRLTGCRKTTHTKKRHMNAQTGGAPSATALIGPYKGNSLYDVTLNQ